MGKPEVTHVKADESPESIEKIILEEGAVIIDELITSAFVDQILDDLRPWFERTDTTKGEWLGKQTKRVHALLRKSKTVQENVCNPLILGSLDRLLGLWCDKYQMSSCSLTAIGPGEKAQELHRDDLMYPTVHPSERIMHCTTLWALTDFCDENGATRVIPYSHLWDDDRVPKVEETCAAEMKKGSVILYNGATYHGGGTNRTDDEWRFALYTSYNLGWLKQEEQQFLVNPPDVAKDFPERLQKLIGYQIHTPFLGWYDLQDPIVVLRGYEEMSGEKLDDFDAGDTDHDRVVLSKKIRRA